MARKMLYLLLQPWDIRLESLLEMPNVSASLYFNVNYFDLFRYYLATKNKQHNNIEIE